jgi:hypothetical protein
VPRDLLTGAERVMGKLAEDVQKMWGHQA